LEFRADEGRRWWCNGNELAEMKGMYDIDLAISPCTNTLPIRRLSMNVGESIALNAVWVRFPDFSVLPLSQQYTRLGDRRYAYESRGGQFRAELEVDDLGLVITYGAFWHRVAELAEGS